MNLLDELTAAGGLGTGELVARSVEWNGHTLPLHFRDLPGGHVQALLKKDNVDPAIIVAALCNEDGSQALTQEQAESLKLGLRAAIVREAMDVFGFTTKARDEAKKD